jgi:hypothetical protein
MIVNKIFLVNLGAFFCMVPYISIYPTHTDIQYPIIIICCLVMLFDIYKRKIFLNNFELYFLFLALLSFVYINPSVDFNYLLSKRVSLFAGFMIFYVYSRYWRMINPNYIISGIYLNFIATILQLLSPNLFGYFSILIGRPFTINGISELRGLTGLTAEPAYLGGLSIAYFLIGYILKNEKRISNKCFYFLSITSIILNALSMSATGIVMLIVVTVTYLVLSHHKVYHKMIYVFLAIGLLSMILLQTGMSGRNVVVINSFLNDSDDLFISDPSLAYRLMSLAVGLQSMLSGNILGHGIGTLDVFAVDLMANTYLHKILILANGSERQPYSSMGLYLFELGVFFLVMLIWLYVSSLKSTYTYIVRIPIILFIIGAFSMMFPPFWILMAATDKRSEYYKHHFLLPRHTIKR